IEYVVDKVVRDGTRLTMQVLGTNSVDDRIVKLKRVEAVDADGNIYKANIFNATGAQLLQVNLREGIKTRFEVTLPNVPARTTEFKRLDIVYWDNGRFDDKVIKFTNVSLQPVNTKPVDSKPPD